MSTSGKNDRLDVLMHVETKGLEFYCHDNSVNLYQDVFNPLPQNPVLVDSEELIDCMAFTIVFNSISVISRRPVHLSMLSRSSFNPFPNGKF